MPDSVVLLAGFVLAHAAWRGLLLMNRTSSAVLRMIVWSRSPGIDPRGRKPSPLGS